MSLTTKVRAVEIWLSFQTMPPLLDLLVLEFRQDKAFEVAGQSCRTVRQGRYGKVAFQDGNEDYLSDFMQFDVVCLLSIIMTRCAPDLLSDFKTNATKSLIYAVVLDFCNLGISI